MNNIRSTAAINARELELGGKGSWHDEFKESAYIYVGGLDPGLTEGDVVTIFSQYGEPVDINLPRDKSTSKPRGFGFLMYEDQRSTNLAVDNLNGTQVLGRTLRVDHVKDYKHLERGEDGKMKERDAFKGESLNARPELHYRPPSDSPDEESEAESLGSIDPDDPMASYLIEQKKAKKKEKAAAAGGGKKRKHEGETKEERKKRKETKRLKKLLKEVGGSDRRKDDHDVDGDRRPPRLRSRSPPPRRSDDADRDRGGDRRRYDDRDREERRRYDHERERDGRDDRERERRRERAERR